MLIDAKMSRLDNGLRVVTAVVPRVESVGVGVWIGCGSRDEPDALAGISHFIEHMVFKGTKNRSAREIACVVESKGGYLNAFTQEELTCYYARVPDEHLEEAMDVLADVILNPLFRAEDLEKERGVILEEIKMYRDQPQQRVQELLNCALWLNHPVGRPVAGYPESVGRINRQSLLEFKALHYRPARTVVAVAGHIEHEACVRMVSSHLRWKSCSRRMPVRRRVTTRTAQKPVVIETKEVEQPHFALGIRLFGRSDRRRYALRVLNAILGENMSSRLFQIVREEYGLAYSISSGVQLLGDTGALFVGAGLDSKRAAKGIELIVGELTRLKERRVGRAELERAKDYVVGQLKLTLESVTNQMMWVGENFLLRGRFVSPESVVREIVQVSAEDVRTIARAFFRRSRLSAAMVCPPDGFWTCRRLGDLIGRL